MNKSNLVAAFAPQGNLVASFLHLRNPLINKYIVNHEVRTINCHMTVGDFQKDQSVNNLQWTSKELKFWKWATIYEEIWCFIHLLKHITLHLLALEQVKSDLETRGESGNSFFIHMSVFFLFLWTRGHFYDFFVSPASVFET